MPEADFNQLAIRLRGGRRDKQVILTFNPVSVNHWLKRRFFDVPRADTVTLRTTYRDNRFLPKEDGEVLESFRETDPYYYTVYCLGEWGVTGNSIFDTQAVSERLRTVRSLPVRRGSFYARERESVLEEIRFCEEENGSIAVSCRPKRVCSTSSARIRQRMAPIILRHQVIERKSGRQAAVLRQQCDEDQFAKQLYCLGMYYGGALIACEVNFSTYPVRELQRLHYPRQYYREVYDNILRETEYRYGFVTNRLTQSGYSGRACQACTGSAVAFLR